MTDLIPLLSDDPEELEALLLCSADYDEPRDGAFEKVGAALGVGAVALGAASSSGALASHAASTSMIAKPLTLLSLGKWLLAGLGAGFVASGGAHYVLRSPAPSVEPSVVATTVVLARMPARAEPARVVPQGAVEPAVTDEEARPAPPPAAAAAAVPPASTASPATPVVKPGPSSASFAPLEGARVPAVPSATATATSVALASTLGEETGALDRVREHIAAGLPSQALAELDHYRESWPQGALGAEASLLREEALLRAGRRADAEREAETLIAHAPQSRYATRARELLGVATAASGRGP
jgi:hypothetical protein